MDDYPVMLGSGELPCFKCLICGRGFSAYKSLYQHLRKAHKIIIQIAGNAKCFVNDCGFSARKVSDLRQHLKERHDINDECSKLSFPSMEEFETWKTNTERKMRCLFVQCWGRKKLCDGSSRISLFCHRSGMYCPRGIGKRSLKSQGSSKFGGKCTAQMEVTVTKEGSVEVTYYSSHHGHSNHLAHLKLSDEERNMIAGKLAEGISFDDILDDVRQSWNAEGGTSRIQLLTRKDLHNIAQGFGLKKRSCGPKDSGNSGLSSTIPMGDGGSEVLTTVEVTTEVREPVNNRLVAPQRIKRPTTERFKTVKKLRFLLGLLKDSELDEECLRCVNKSVDACINVVRRNMQRRHSTRGAVKKLPRTTLIHLEKTSTHQNTEFNMSKRQTCIEKDTELDVINIHTGFDHTY